MKAACKCNGVFCLKKLKNEESIWLKQRKSKLKNEESIWVKQRKSKGPCCWTML